jgi:hypothetical protein
MAMGMSAMYGAENMMQQMNSFNNFRMQQHQQMRGFRPPQGQYHQTSEDIRMGGGSHFWRRRGKWFGGGRGTNGYGINLNQRPGHQRGQDGALVFPDSRGRYNRKAVQNTNDMMKAARGNFDFNNDGRTDLFERIRGRGLKSKYAKLDRNRDGRLSAHEISAGGGKVWVDSNRNGRVRGHELHSPFRVPTNDSWGRRGTSRLDFVDPHSRTAHTTPNRPWSFGGYPHGCGCGHGGFNYGHHMPNFPGGGRFF